MIIYVWKNLQKHDHNLQLGIQWHGGGQDQQIEKHQLYTSDPANQEEK